MKRFRLWLLFSLLFLSQAASAQHLESFSKADTLRGSLSPLRTCYDINYYHLDIRVDVGQQFISGSNLFRFTATRDFNKLQFDLFDNYEIEKIVYQGKELEYTAEYDAVFIQFPAIIKKGSKAEFTVFYSGTPMIAQDAPWGGGFVFTEDAGTAPWVSVACQGLGASAWWPNKDHQSDEVDSMLISVTVPRGLKNISNGRLISTEVQPDGATKFNWFVSYPINNYNVTLNIGDFAHFSDEYIGLKGKLTLDYYVLRENLDKAKAQFEQVKKVLKSFEYWFGAYPFYRDGYKLIETPYLGMEHQSAISYGNKYKNGYLGSDLSKTGLGLFWDYIIVHESGHEWFGNNITSKDLADLWIHESFTTYSEALYIESQQGKKAGVQYLNGLRLTIQNDSTIIGPYNVNREGSEDMYFKGANLLHTIRTIINNDQQWLRILRGLNQAFKLQTVTSEQIISYINKQSGKNLTPIFDQYLRFKDIPTLVLTRASGNSVAYRWQSDVKGFNMPVKVKLPGTSEWQLIQPTNIAKILTVQGPASELLIDTDNFYIKTKILAN